MTCPFDIEFAAGKLDEIQRAVVEGFRAVPRGGVEVGGVLFGTRSEGRIRIEAHRPVECQHKTGPSFQLSEADLERLVETIARGPGAPLGWYHSHTRSDLFLSEEDREIYDRFFPEPWQVALVLRPERSGEVRSEFFHRAKPGLTTELRTEPRTEPSPDLSPELTGESEPAEEIERGNGGVLMAAVLAFAVLAAGAFVTRASWMPDRSPLQLKASDADGKLLVRWMPIRNQPGKLTIDDGEKRTVIQLDPLQVSRGFYVYGRRSESAIVGMKVGEAQEHTTFFAPIAPKEPIF